LALALADEVVVCLLDAATFNAPVSVAERASSALVVSTADAKDSANPKLKLLPEAAPVDVVVSVPVCVALRETLCSVSVGPELMVALVL
jgi:hypothetical protein